MSNSINKPYVLYVAETIYFEVLKIKKTNKISNVEAFERFIGSETYKTISSGKFHDEVYRKLELIFENVGPREVKNIDNPVQTYDVILDQDSEKSSLKKSNSISAKRKFEDASIKSDQRPEISKPRIMLFPFRNLNNQEDNEFLVDGIVDDIITELSMIRLSFILESIVVML